MADNQDSVRGTVDDDDYDVIIKEGGVGDPTVFASFEFGGNTVPSKDAPLENLKITVTVNWPKISRSIKVGYVYVNEVSRVGPYRFGLPYDDATFDLQVKQGIECTIVMDFEATQNGKPVKFSSKLKEEDGYRYILPHVQPEIYRDRLPDNNQK